MRSKSCNSIWRKLAAFIIQFCITYLQADKHQDLFASHRVPVSLDIYFNQNVYGIDFPCLSWINNRFVEKIQKWKEKRALYLNKWRDFTYIRR